jgi:hypothetical protein
MSMYGSAGSQTEEPQNPSLDYAEVQRTQLGDAQSSARDEAEAGQKVRQTSFLYTHRDLQSQNPARARSRGRNVI